MPLMYCKPCDIEWEWGGAPRKNARPHPQVFYCPQCSRGGSWSIRETDLDRCWANRHNFWGKFGRPVEKGGPPPETYAQAFFGPVVALDDIFGGDD